MIESYKATELALLEKKSEKTIRNNKKKYIPIIVRSYRSKQNKKWYSVRYIRRADIEKKTD